MVRKEIKVGEKVYAKWPGSNKYYEAVVVEVLDEEFMVSFSEGSLTTKLDGRLVYKHTFFSSSSPARRRSRSPARRRSRSRSPSRRSASTPKRSSPRQSPTRRARSPGRARKQLQVEEEETKEVKQEVKQETKPPVPDSPSRGRGRPRKRVTQENKPAEQTPVKPKQQQETTTHITRSMTKTMAKEEKEALFDTDKLEQELRESRRGKGKEFEFGGPVGVFLTMLTLPFLVYAFYFYCSGKRSVCSFRNNPIKLPHWRKFFDEGHLMYDAWLLFQVLLFFVPFGKVVQGQSLPDGTRRTYRMNGMVAFVATLAGLFLLKANKIPFESMVYNKFPSLITAALIWSLLIAIFVYVKARREGTGLSAPGNTGNALYDFFMGHQLNPSVGSFDFKFFCESRPGLLAWMVVNFCMASHEYETLHKISPAMFMVCIFQFIYVIDVVIFEASLLSMIDMTHDGFGFMLSFGNLVFVPFMFSIQARFLADHPVYIAWPFVVAIVVLKVVGYIIFRGSNLQKDFFRLQPNDPDFQNKETILTPSGKRLMVFGWWKIVRHPNYLGDILMAISWCFPCGFTHIIPWLYPIYLIVLLVHRERRDEALCRKKYGKSYDEYCRRVPYRILPLVY